jgi:hypothetical protein
MKANNRLSGWHIAVASLAVVIGMGWISNALSKAACRQQVGLWLFKHSLGGRSFYLLDPNDDKDVRATFDSVGAQYTRLASISGNPQAWPRLAMKTNSLIPFLVGVDYFWERQPEVGAGGTKWFFCVFGTVYEIGESGRYAT